MANTFNLELMENLKKSIPLVEEAAVSVKKGAEGYLEVATITNSPKLIKNGENAVSSAEEFVKVSNSLMEVLEKLSSHYRTLEEEL